MHTDLKNFPSLLHAVRKLEKTGVDQFELYYQKKKTFKADSKDQLIESYSQAEDEGLSIRILQEKRKGFSFTTSLEKDAIEKAVDSAVEVAKYLPPDEYNEFFSFGSRVYPEVDAFDPKGAKESIAHKIQLAQELERECRQSDSRITTVRSATFGESIYEMHMVDSNGEYIQHRGSIFTADINCKAEAAGDSEMGSEFAFSNDLDSLAIKQTGVTAAQRAIERLGAKQPKTMQCPAVFRNSVVASILDFISESFSAEAIDKGRSILADKKGQKIFAEGVTIVDDGLMAGGYGTSPFDAEGVPSGKTVLVDGGFLNGFLYDTYYAKKMEKTPTGNAARGIKSPPSIQTTNLYLQKGRKTAEKLIQEVSNGILITDLLGVHTANPVTGDFSLGASGILIENGRLTAPARGFAVAGNVLELFQQMVEAGSDLKFFGGTGAPSILIGRLSVSGT